MLQIFRGNLVEYNRFLDKLKHYIWGFPLCRILGSLLQEWVRVSGAVRLPADQGRPVQFSFPMLSFLSELV